MYKSVHIFAFPTFINFARIIQEFFFILRYLKKIHSVQGINFKVNKTKKNGNKSPLLIHSLVVSCNTFIQRPVENSSTESSIKQQLYGLVYHPMGIMYALK